MTPLSLPLKTITPDPIRYAVTPVCMFRVWQFEVQVTHWWPVVDILSVLDSTEGLNRRHAEDEYRKAEARVSP